MAKKLSRCPLYFAVSITLTLFGSTSSSEGGYPPSLEPAWTIDLPAPPGSLVGVYPDFRTVEGLIVPLKDGHLIRIDSRGRIIWRTQIGDAVLNTVAIGNLGDPAHPGIVAIADLRDVVALTSDGEILWRFTLPGEPESPLPGKVSGHRGPVCGDLDGDGTDEIMVSNNFGWLVCLNADGTLRWRMHADRFRAGPPAVGDVDGDGRSEVVYGTENERILCLDADGRILWLHRVPGKFGRSYIVLADLNHDGLLEAAWSTSFNTVNSRVYVAHASDGSPYWSAKTILHGYGSLSVGDLNDDGNPDLVFVDRANTVYAFSGGGEELWRNTTGGNAYLFPQSLGDVDGDGGIEVVAVVRGKNIDGKNFFIIDGRTGDTEAAYHLEGSASFSPLLCDLDADGRLEVLAVSKNRATLEVYRFGGKDRSRVPWPTDRFDSSRTGCFPAEAKAKTFQKSGTAVPVLELRVTKPVLLGKNIVDLDLPSQLPEKAFLSVLVTAPSGERTTLLKSLDPEKPDSGVPVSLGESGSHRVEIALWDESVRPARKLAEGFLETDPGTAETLKRWTDERLLKVEKSLPDLREKNPEAVRLIHRSMAIAGGDLAFLVSRMEDARDLPPTKKDALVVEVNRFRRSVQEIETLVQIVQKSPHLSLAVWEDENPWDLESPFDRVPERFAENPVSEVWMFGGETEYRAFHVLNLRPEPVDVQFRVPHSGPLNPREVVNVPRDDGIWVPDALPNMSQSRTLHLAPGEVRQVWFDVSAGGLPPGLHTYRVEVLPLGSDEDRFGIVFRLTVDPVRLVDAPEFPICNWTRPSSILSLSDEPGIVEHVLDQGMNVFTIAAPSRRCDEEGHLIGHPNWTSIDEELSHLDPAKAILLISGPHVVLPGGVEKGSEVWKTGLRNVMRELAAHLAEKGYPLDRWAYYPVDEPGLFGGTKIEELRRIVEPAKEVAPEIQFYTDPAGGVTRDNFAHLADDIDIWAPELAMLRRNPDLSAFFLETGGWVWSYEAPGEVKKILPLGYYRAQPLTAAWMGLQGTGHWAFGYTSGGNDLWLTSSPTEYGDQYLDGARIVQSRRWLAFLDGAEDARMVWLLRRVAAEAKDRGIQADDLKEAEELIGPRLRHLLRRQWEQDDITRYLIDYEIDLDELNEIRLEIARLVSSLRALMTDEESRSRKR